MSKIGYFFIQLIGMAPVKQVCPGYPILLGAETQATLISPLIKQTGAIYYVSFHGCFRLDG
jgi:hypothetical protein